MAAGNSEQRAKNVQKWNQLQDDSEREKFLESLLDPGAAAEIHDHKDHRNDGMDDERRVWSGVAWVNLAKPVRQIRIEASDKRDARGAREPSRTNSGNGDAEQKRKRGDEPGGAHASRHVTDRLHASLQHADVLLADGDEQGQCCADVEQTREHAAP